MGHEEEKREAEQSNFLNDLKASVYREFCSQREKNVEECLLFDLRRFHEDSIAMLCYLIPEIYMEFQN